MLCFNPFPLNCLSVIDSYDDQLDQNNDGFTQEKRRSQKVSERERAREMMNLDGRLYIACDFQGNS